jgi:glycerol-3-phosphate acyltransferase PlsY
MNGPIGAAALVLIAYLVGALPVGLVIGRLVGGVDIRQTGSGRTGATNAMRSLGTRWAALVFVLDLGKGAAAVLLAGSLYQAGPAGSPEVVAAAAGLAAVVGHNWSVFIRFSGGRGVATSAGALLALAPVTIAILAPLAALIVLWTRYVSVASMAAAVLAVPLTVALLPSGLAGPAAIGFSVVAAALIVAAHRDNIARLRNGTERRWGETERTASGG